jgi:hypothetical protein
MDGVKSALDRVKSNAQALAAIDATLKAADVLATELIDEGGAFRESAAKDIDGTAAPIRVMRPQFIGSGTMPVGTSWANARPLVQKLWFLVMLLEQGLPPDVDLGDGWTSALASAVVDLPVTIGNAAGVALKVAAKAATTVAKTAVDVVGSTAWAFVKQGWPLLLVAGVGVATYVYFKPNLTKLVTP